MDSQDRNPDVRLRLIEAAMSNPEICTGVTHDHSFLTKLGDRIVSKHTIAAAQAISFADAVYDLLDKDFK